MEFYLSKVLKLLVFDLDGTLVDSRRDIATSVNHALTSVGCATLSIETIIGMVGNGAHDLLSRCIAASGERDISPAKIHATYDSFMAHYQIHCLSETTPYPGVLASIDMLGHYKKAVLTNKPEKPALKILSGLGLDKYFSLVLGGDNPYGQKPDPAALQHIMDTEKCGPEVTAMIGDGIQDLGAARNAKAKFLGFLGGIGEPEEILSETPDGVFNDMQNLPEAIALLETKMASAGDYR